MSSILECNSEMTTFGSYGFFLAFRNNLSPGPFLGTIQEFFFPRKKSRTGT